MPSVEFEQLLRTHASERTRESLPDLLGALGELGFAWRDLARIFGVSIAALRRWRQGEPASDDHRWRVARLAAFCEIVQEHCMIDDPASWLETPIHIAAPTTGLDLIANERFDLAFRLAADDASDPDSILDAFNAGWRQQFATSVEVFVAAEGHRGLRAM